MDAPIMGTTLAIRRAWRFGAIYLSSGFVFIALVETIITYATKRHEPLSLLAAPGWIYLALTAPLLGHLARRYSESLDSATVKYQNLIQSSPDGIVLSTPDGRIVSANPAACRILGYSEAELIRGGRDLIVDGEDAEYQRFASQREKAGSASGDLWVKRKTRQRIRLHIESSVFKDGDHRFNSLILRDLTPELTLQHDHKLSSVAFSNASEAIAILDEDFRILSANPAFLRMGAVSNAAVQGRNTLYDVLRTDSSVRSEMSRTLASRDLWTGEFVARRMDGEVVNCLAKIAKVVNDKLACCNYVATFSDLSEVHEYRRKIAEAGLADPVTGLPNRFALEQQAETLLGAANPQSETVVLFLINVDHFQTVNESFGHAAGDACLRELGNRLKEISGDGCFLARHHGDSFVILMSGLSSLAVDSGLLARRIHRVFDRTIELSGMEIGLTASVGIGIYPEDGSSYGQLLRRAENALADVKGDGGNDFRYYAAGSEVRAKEFLSKSGQIRRGLQNQEFVPYYQPIVCARTGRIVKLEALARWQHPEQGLLGPGEFIEVAEQAGLISELSESLLIQAADMLRQLRQSSHFQPSIAVNLSARQFRHPGLAERLKSIVIAKGMEPRNFVLEITESLLMQNTAANVAIIRQLKKYGFGIYVDDFGTGYSSLNYLRQFDVDGIKIDRLFTASLPHDKTNAALVRAILAVARELGLEVVAEGVETAEQADCLSSLDCRYLQGFRFSRPVPGERLRHLLMQSNG